MGAQQQRHHGKEENFSDKLTGPILSNMEQREIDRVRKCVGENVKVQSGLGENVHIQIRTSTV